MSSWRAPASAAIATSLRQLELGREQAIRALELLLGRYPSAAAATAPQLPGFPGEVPTGLPSALLERRPDVDRRGAARRGRVQPDRRGQGGPPAGHLPDHRRQRDLERAVPAEGSRQSGVERRRQPAGADLQGRRAQDAGRDPHRRAETGDRRIRRGRTARVWRGRRRPGRRDRRARARADPDADPVRQPAGARRRADPVQGGEHRSPVRRRSDSSR